MRLCAQGWRLEVDVQKATGAFSFTFLFAFFTNVHALLSCSLVHEYLIPLPLTHYTSPQAYTNITNIVVRLSPKDASEDAMQHALLISSHFDSTLGTPGASDASVGIAGTLLRHTTHPQSCNALTSRIAQSCWR